MKRFPSNFVPDLRGTRRATAVLFALVVLIVIVHGFVWPPDPLAMDSATYAAIANELRAGETLYLDNWDIKPPVVFGIWAAAQAVFGYGQEAAPLNIIFVVLTMFAIYAATRIDSRSEYPPLIAACLWAFVSATPTLEGFQPNTEIFINATQTAAFALLLFAATRKVGLGTALAIGLLFAFASFYKTVAVAFAGLTVGAYLVCERAGPPSLRVRNAAAMVGVAGLCWVALFLYFALAGHFAAFWDANFVFTRSYAGNLFWNLLVGAQPARLLPPFAYPIYPLFAAAALTLVLARNAGASPRTLLGIAFALAVFVEVALPGRFFNHYYQLWLPPLCIGTAWGLEKLREARGLAVFQAATAGILLLTFGLQASMLRSSRREIYESVWEGRLLHSSRAATLIDELLEPDETFFQWGHHVELYYYTARRPPAGEYRAGPVFVGNRTGERLQILLEDLAENQPELIVSTGGWHLMPDREPVSRWIVERYTLFWPEADSLYDPQRIRFYYRKDGQLEQRLDRLQVANVSTESSR